MDNQQIARAYGREAAIAHCARDPKQEELVGQQFWDWMIQAKVTKEAFRAFDDAYWKWIDNYGKGE